MWMKAANHRDLSYAMSFGTTTDEEKRTATHVFVKSVSLGSGGKCKREKAFHLSGICRHEGYTLLDILGEYVYIPLI